jgi:hypothetical protein
MSLIGLCLDRRKCVARNFLKEFLREQVLKKSQHVGKDLGKSARRWGKTPRKVLACGKKTGKTGDFVIPDYLMPSYLENTNFRCFAGHARGMENCVENTYSRRPAGRQGGCAARQVARYLRRRAAGSAKTMKT